LEEARSFDIAVGDVGRVTNVGDEARAVYYGYGGLGGGNVWTWWLTMKNVSDTHN
jgi:hypothetical protein